MAADDFPHIAAWMGSDPHTADALDEAVLQRACRAAVDIVGPLGRSGHGPEARAAIVKVLAGMEAAPARAFSEADVLALSERLRRMIYLEIMHYRRAFVRDLEAGAFND